MEIDHIPNESKYLKCLEKDFISKTILFKKICNNAWYSGVIKI